MHARALRGVDPLVLSIWIGLFTGLAEAAIWLLYRVAYQGKAILSPNEVLWMAPVADVFLFAILGALLSLAGVIYPRLRSLQLVAFVLLTGAFFALLLHVGGVHPAAWLVLAVGLGFQASRALAAHEAWLRRALHVTTGWVTLWRRKKPATNPDSETSPVPVIDRRRVLGASVLTIAGLMGASNLRRRQLTSRALDALPRATGTPNVLFIVLDTVRAASLGLHGNARNTSPHLDTLAKGGVTFSRAYAPSSWTLPSHATFFTGKYLHELDVALERPLPAGVRTLAEALRDKGYETAGFSANNWFVTRQYGMDRGFASFDDCDPTSWGQILSTTSVGDKLLSYPVGRKVLLGKDDFPGRRPAASINASTMAWLAERDDSRPFFAFINYLDAHEPYYARPEFAELFDTATPAERWLSKDTPCQTRDPQVQAWLAEYERCIAGLDEDLGRLLTVLKNMALLDDTLVIVTSDHGDQFGEHGLLDHGNSLYMPVMHVPLVVRLPGRVPATVVPTQRPVSLRDLPATVMDLLGFDAEFPGASWRASWEAEAHRKTGSSSPLLFELRPKYEEDSPPPWRPISHGPMSSLVHDNLYYIRNGDGREELYDHVRDPGEQDNLAGKAGMQGQLAALERAMENIRSGRG